MKFAKSLAITLLLAMGLNASANDSFDKLSVTVEIEEDVYTYEHANNGASPMWCHGGTSIVRVGNEVFASGIETLADVKPLNNCLPFLLHRTDGGWKQVFEGTKRTREPSPLAMFQTGRVFLSVNPTLASPGSYSGPARPGILEFQAITPDETPRLVAPVWDGKPAFNEHSYRSFAADGEKKEFILLQNIGYTHAEWSFRDSNAKWSAQGKLEWPRDSEPKNSDPIRVCYPAVALKDRRVYFCGVSDVVEPNQEWREYKRELTGREWDYDFRRLFFTWSDDIEKGEFHDWIEVSSRDKTAGRIRMCDLHVAQNGDVFVLWNEYALDHRLRAKFFPNAKQRYSLECAILRDGQVVRRNTLVEGGDGLSGLVPGKGRFHVTQDNRLIVLYYQGGLSERFQQLSENRILELDHDGNASQPATISLSQPFKSFFTSTGRAGCKPSNILDIFGAVGNTMRYARIRVR